MTQMTSNCCNAPVEIKQDGSGGWYVCTKCKKEGVGVAQLTSNEEKIVFDFETKFGNCFQPFGDKLDEAKQYLRDSLHSQKERVVEMCEEMKKPITREMLNAVINTGRGTGSLEQVQYNQALSDLKTKIEDEL